MNIVITGASGGIGTAIAKALSEHNLALHYNCTEIAKDVKNCIIVQADLASEEQCQKMFAKILQKMGHIDVLINNCGISEFSLLQDLTLEKWNTMLAVNLGSAFLCTKEVIPSMLQIGKGNIVNISSVWGQCGASCEAHYSASKGGLIAFTKAMAQELAPSNVLVNCICPGYIETAMNSAISQEDKENFIAEIPLQRAGKPEDIANAVKFLIEQEYITGQVLAVNGGLYM